MDEVGIDVIECRNTLESEIISSAAINDSFRASKVVFVFLCNKAMFKLWSDDGGYSRQDLSFGTGAPSRCR